MYVGLEKMTAQRGDAIIKEIAFHLVELGHHHHPPPHSCHFISLQMHLVVTDQKNTFYMLCLRAKMYQVGVH